MGEPKTNMKNETTSGKPNKLRHFLPLLALMLGLGLPAVAYAIDNCEDCLSSCDINFRDSAWYCYQSPDPGTCLDQAYQTQLNCRNNCYSTVCQ
jgi:hypothetical protein